MQILLSLSCQALELLVFWRKRGPIGKLHNLINWIRYSPQRRQAFQNVTTEEAEVRDGTFSFSSMKLMLI
jgi:hypothetical protein